MSAEVQAPAEPVVLESGRYKVFQAPDGSWILARAVDTCQTCQGCGCGEQAEPIHVPALVIRMAQTGDISMMGKLKAMMGRG